MLFILSKPVLLLSTEESLHILHGNFSEITEKGPNVAQNRTKKGSILNLMNHYLFVAVMSTTELLTRPSVGVTPFSIIRLRS